MKLPLAGVERESWQAAARRWSLPVICSALVLQQAFLRGSQLDPATLWFDDVWVAVTTRVPLSDLWTVPTAAPIGFLLVSRLLRGIFGDPEVSLQLWPLLSGLATIPLSAWLVWRVTESRTLAAGGAALIAANPLLAQYSIFVKAFTTDAACACVLLLLGYGAIRQPEPGRVAKLALAGVVCLMLSFSAALLSLALVNTCLPAAFFRSRGRVLEAEPPGDRDAGGRRTGRVAAVVVGFDLALAVSYLTLMRHGVTELVVEYWRPYYLATESAHAAATFLWTVATEALAGAMPEGLRWMWPGAILGLASLHLRSHRRWFGVSLAGVWALWLIASAVRAYPIGGGRTDIFSFPATLLLVCVAVVEIGRVLRAPRPVAVGFASIAIGWAVLAPPAVAYFDVPGDSALVGRLQADLEPADGLLLYPRAGYLMGYYGDWPIELEADNELAPGFKVVLERPGSMTLSYRPREALASELDGFLRGGRHRRLWYVGARVQPAEGLDAFVVGALEGSGYRVTERRATRRTTLLTFELLDSGEAPAPAIPPVLIDLGEEGDQAWLGSGWWHRERQPAFSFRWGVEDESYVVAPLRWAAYRDPPTDADDSAYTLRFRGHPFIHPEMPSPAVDIDIDGDLVGRVELEATGPRVYELAIPYRALKRGLSVVRFRYSEAVSPRELGLSDDPRRLGFLFDWIRFDPAANDTGSE